MWHISLLSLSFCLSVSLSLSHVGAAVTQDGQVRSLRFSHRFEVRGIFRSGLLGVTSIRSADEVLVTAQVFNSSHCVWISLVCVFLLPILIALCWDTPSLPMIPRMLCPLTVSCPSAPTGLSKLLMIGGLVRLFLTTPIHPISRILRHTHSTLPSFTLSDHDTHFLRAPITFLPSSSTGV